MKLRKLSFKNFKSYSNIMTEISFDSNPTLNLIVGENGTGKTSIAECATYLLYGKIENFTSSDIPNRINKNFYGKIELDCDGHIIIIERGLNPGLFKVQIDDKNIDTAGKQNIQSMLEENYFKIPYTVFHNILVLEVGEVKSLLSMNVADKRNIIDKICGFTIYNFYSKCVKEDLKSLDNQISSNIGSISSMNYNIEQYDRQIEEINENATTQEELDDLKKQIDEAKKLKLSNDEMLKKIRTAGEQLKGTNIKKKGEYNNLKDKIAVIDKKIQLIDGGKCPTCGTSLDTEDFQKEKEELLETRKDYEDQMKKIVEMASKTKSKLTLLGNKEQEISKKNSQIPLADLQSDFKYKSAMKEKNVSPIETLKNNMISELSTLNEERKKLDEEKKVFDFILMMCSDGGIKRYIAQKYVPIINEIISNMMNYMNLNYNVTFDNDFNATIIQNGMNVKYSTLSKGEKRRVDFAAVISFIRFLKLQFGELNLLFLDEIFSNVDINGVNDYLSILRDLSSDLNLNIYLIHHAKLEGVMFDKVIQTTKKDGFSHIEYI